MFNWLKSLQFNFGFGESTTQCTELLVNFYNFICVLLIIISFLIGYWMFFILTNHVFKQIKLLNIFNLYFILKNKISIKTYLNTNLEDRSFKYMSISDIKEYTVLEGSWGLIPLSFVSTAAYPSIGIEYGLSSDITPLVTLKVIANQWYWVFELEAKVSPGIVEGNDNFFFERSNMYKLFVDTYGDSEAFYKGLKEMDEYQILTRNIDMNLKNVEDPGFYRLLAVDNKLVLPVNTPIKLIITSADVLHAFAIPGWGVKMDAIPGRLSEQVILIERPGLYWGQCSELCGPYHGYMPVCIEVTSYPIFLKNFFLEELNN